MAFGLLGMMITFSRRAQRAAYNRLDGQVGAGARALSMLRRGWVVEEVVGFTKQQDMVHRVVGPPGILLVGEGNPNRLKQLMAGERRKHERVAFEVPIQEIVVGKESGQVPLSKLVRHVQKMKRQVKPAEITDVLLRIKALDAQRPEGSAPPRSGAHEHEGHAAEHEGPLSQRVLSFSCRVSYRAAAAPGWPAGRRSSRRCPSRRT